jgi:hypothetical protein
LSLPCKYKVKRLYPSLCYNIYSTVKESRDFLLFIFDHRELTILVFFTSFFCLDRWSIPSRQFSILWSYLDIILLFPSYLYFILFNLTSLQWTDLGCHLFLCFSMTLSSKIWEYSFLGREDGREILHGLHVKDTGESPCPSHILTSRQYSFL